VLRRFLPFVLLLAAGCPDSNSGTTGDTANVTSGVPLTGKIQKKTPTTKPDAPPAKEDSFPKDRLIELYRADQGVGDKAAVYKKYGLVDDKGKEVAAKVEEYEAALQRFANEHPDEWSKLADELMTRPGATDVEKK